MRNHREEPERDCKPDSVLGLRGRSGRGFAGLLSILTLYVTESLSSADIFARSRCAPFETVLMVEPTQDRSRHDPRVMRETTASDQGRG